MNILKSHSKVGGGIIYPYFISVLYAYRRNHSYFCSERRRLCNCSCHIHAFPSHCCCGCHSTTTESTAVITTAITATAVITTTTANGIGTPEPEEVLTDGDGYTCIPVDEINCETSREGMLFCTHVHSHVPIIPAIAIPPCYSHFSSLIHHCTHNVHFFPLSFHTYPSFLFASPSVSTVFPALILCVPVLHVLLLQALGVLLLPSLLCVLQKDLKEQQRNQALANYLCHLATFC